MNTPMTRCSVAGCDRPQHAKSLCHGHWRRQGGSVPADKPLRIVGDDRARFWSKVDKSGACWVWLGSVSAGGYGQFKVGKKAHYSHRWAYDQLVGIPEGNTTLDHLCENKRCVNPAHLEPVTRGENSRRHYRRRAAEATAPDLHRDRWATHASHLAAAKLAI